MGLSQRLHGIHCVRVCVTQCDAVCVDMCDAVRDSEWCTPARCVKCDAMYAMHVYNCAMAASVYVGLRAPQLAPHCLLGFSVRFST